MGGDWVACINSRDLSVQNLNNCLRVLHLWCTDQVSDVRLLWGHDITELNIYHVIFSLACRLFKLAHVLSNFQFTQVNTWDGFLYFPANRSSTRLCWMMVLNRDSSSGSTPGQESSSLLKIMVKSACKMESLRAMHSLKKNYYFRIRSNRVELRTLSTDKE